MTAEAEISRPKTRSFRPAYPARAATVSIPRIKADLACALARWNSASVTPSSRPVSTPRISRSTVSCLSGETEAEMVNRPAPVSALLAL